MKYKLIDKAMIGKGIQIGWGFPHTAKYLWQWAFKIDLERYNILVTDPIDVLNFIIVHMTYMRDPDQFNLFDRWPESAEEVVEFIFANKKDDCDGSMVSVASILYSLGDKNIRLAIGDYGTPDKKGRHAYCLLHDNNNPTNPFILDAVGDTIQEKLYRIDSNPGYFTLISADPWTKRMWAHGEWIEKYS